MSSKQIKLKEEEEIIENIIPAVDAFKFFDSDKDGLVKKNDIETLFNNLDIKFIPKDIEEYIKNLTNNEQDKIPEKFFEDMADENKEMTDETKIEELLQIFKLFDKKGNGKLRVSYVEEILKILGKGLLKDEEISILLQSSDIEGDNFIDIDDFMKMMMNK
jgi:Ca2+-binding EF-hand superfamily protein